MKNKLRSNSPINSKLSQSNTLGNPAPFEAENSKNLNTTIPDSLKHLVNLNHSSLFFPLD